ncbi:hypothetical protein [Streptomyces sp. NPDC048521]|uniref:hypothetical protein n=1 Tax=Streptomyces sp. NPDC048521 TaxID=3365566 RepID=UPI00371C31F6
MWPEQQPPGGAQNPQPNPYQQPGYQQPNPYQQPGPQQYPQAGQYGQQQPAGQYAQQQAAQYGQQPQWGQQPTVPMPESPQGGGGRTKLIAVIAATAVVVTAAVTGFLVLGGSKDDEAEGGKNGQHTSGPPTAEPTPTATSSATEDDPRGNETAKPTVAGWKVVVNPKWGIAFDVPADWVVRSPGLGIGFEFEDEKQKGITMSGAAEYKPEWCTSDTDKDGRTEDTPLAAVGTKGAVGAKNTDEIALKTPAWWVFGGYTDPDKKSISWDKKATPFTTTSGIKGSYAWAQSTDTPRKGKCVSDGKALTFGFENSAHKFVSFNFYGAKGVKGEVPKATVLKVLGTVRLHGTPTHE